jgi:hypothetical protein
MLEAMLVALVMGALTRWQAKRRGRGDGSRCHSWSDATIT